MLDWWHVAVRFERILHATRGLGATDAHLAGEAVRGLERAKWRLWHGRSPGCQRNLAVLCRRTHMYQLVLIANNGAYGGSNAHVPNGEAYERQVFHTHGQPQATISFFEIDNIEGMKERHRLGAGKQNGWKYPPAGSLR